MPQPDLIVTPFGENAPSNAIDDIPESRSPGDLLEKATWSEGFPGLTMIPLSAGGIPPRGQDFNGVLKAISEHVVFQGGGGQYAWSQEWVDANGGYPAGAVLASNDGMNIYVSTVDNNDVNFNTTPSSIGNQWLLIAGTELSTVVPQAEAEVGTATTRRAWTAQRVRQAITGWWSGIRANNLPLQSSIPQVPDAETVQEALAGLGESVRSATETVQGTMRLATTAQAQELTADDVAITPATLVAAFMGANQLLSESGFQVMPGGVILQWGPTPNLTGGASATVSYPIAYKDRVFATVPVSGLNTDGTTPCSLSVDATSVPDRKAQIIFRNRSAAVDQGGFYISIGR